MPPSNSLFTHLPLNSSEIRDRRRRISTRLSGARGSGWCLCVSDYLQMYQVIFSSLSFNFPHTDSPLLYPSFLLGVLLTHMHPFYFSSFPSIGISPQKILIFKFLINEKLELEMDELCRILFYYFFNNDLFLNSIQK